MAERICAVEGCDRVEKARGWCSGHHRRWQRTGDVRADEPLRSFNPDSYAAVHWRVRNVRGLARDHRCYFCGEQADEWAYDHSDADEIAGMNNGRVVTYSLDAGRYVPACRSCHQRMDRERSTHCPQGHPFTLGNTWRSVRADGSTFRRCSTCHREYEARRAAAKREENRV